MSNRQNGRSISLVAAASLVAAQYRCVKLNTSGQMVLAGASDLAQIGVLQEKPDTGQVGNVQVDGITKAKAGAAIVAGDRLTTDAAGAFIPAVATKQVLGIAMTSAASGDIFSMLLAARGVA